MDGTPACALSLNGATVNLYGDIAVISDGSISLKNVTFQSGDGNQHKLQFIVPWASPQTCGDFSTTAQTTTTHLLFFVYTPCTLSINNNSSGDGAQLFGKNVQILNQFTLNFHGFQIPGAGGTTGYNVSVRYKREIVNP